MAVLHQRGETWIPLHQVRKLEVKMSMFEMFRDKLKDHTNSNSAHWYAFILEDNTYKFKWSEVSPPDNYIKNLKKDGWHIHVAYDK